METQTTKVCSRCGYKLSISAFGLRKERPGQTKGHCKRCETLRRYSISAKDYDVLLEKQQRRCRGCHLVAPNLAVDHNHLCCPGTRSCGKCIRGLLCNLCNTAVGNMRDSWFVAQNLVTYLKEFENEQFDSDRDRCEFPRNSEKK